MNAKPAGSANIDRTVHGFFGEEGVSCGYDFGESVSSIYEAPFTYGGKITSMQIDLQGDHIKDYDAHIAKTLAQD